jgi:crotonobetainyl-CoA:carnitine CoA-transferase CaiB-like acyl-CoA transferase
MPSALADLKILDFSRVLAGPFATMVLADLGATVTKIEPPAGDDTRQWGPPYDQAGDATYFQSVNRNKLSLVLDFTKAADLDRARALARDSDVVVENFRPGVTERFGLDYETVRRENPAVIYCSITGFGRGKGATLPGYDLLIQALGGLMSITGQPDGEPQKVGVALVDVLAGLFSAVGILAALEYRGRSGEGQRIEVDLLSALLAGLVNQASAYTIAGVVPQRMGNQHPSIAPYEPLRAADREVVVAVGNDRQFGLLCEVLGVPELSLEPRFATNAARVENRDALRVALEERLIAREAGAWAADLTEVGVPAGVVNDIAAAFGLARDLGLGPTVAIERDDGTTVELTRNPIGLSVTPPSYRSAPPRFPRRT